MNIVLPALYGTLGAMAGQTRANYQRIKDNKLMPRHVWLFATPWLLGCVSGATVGLFASSSNGDGAAFASAQLHLTASAYGDYADKVLDHVKLTGQIVFDLIGDSGASDDRNYPGELNVAPQPTESS